MELSKGDATFLCRHGEPYTGSNRHVYFTPKSDYSSGKLQDYFICWGNMPSRVNGWATTIAQVGYYSRYSPSMSTYVNFITGPTSPYAPILKALASRLEITWSKKGEPLYFFIDVSGDFPVSSPVLNHFLKNFRRGVEDPAHIELFNRLVKAGYDPRKAWSTSCLFSLGNDEIYTGIVTGEHKICKGYINQTFFDGNLPDFWRNKDKTWSRSDFFGKCGWTATWGSTKKEKSLRPAVIHQKLRTLLDPKKSIPTDVFFKKRFSAAQPTIPVGAFMRRYDEIYEFVRKELV